MTGGSARSVQRSKQPPAAVQEAAVHARNQGFVHAVQRDDDDEIEFISLDELTNEEHPTDSTDQAVECPDPGRQQSRDRVQQAEASQSMSLSAGRSNDSNGDDNIIAVRGFARRTHLSGWFPRVLDTESTSQRIWWSRRSRALMVQISIIGVILFLNLGLTIFAVSSYGSSNGVGLVYEGKCSTVRALDLWLHLLINLLSTGLLSASNYCMQLQAAPMRRDVDEAHKDAKWLDIGIPSLRNLVYINWWRRVSWALLAFSSVPVHLIYNSAVFQSLSSHSYTVGVVKDSFTNGASWDLANAEDRRFGDPLYASSGLMHWLVSRSLFLAPITAMDADNEQNEDDSFSTCAYSPFAIFVTMVVGIVLVGVIVGIGFRKYEGIMRMVSTNSKAISAACHVLNQDKKEG